MRWTRAFLVAGAALVLALAVLVRLAWDPLQDLDGTVLAAAYDAVTHSATTLSLVRALTHLGDPLVVSFAAVVIAAGLFARRSYRAAAYIAAVRVTSVVVTEGLKAGTARVRPVPLHQLAVAHGHSFPSGHASGSAALWCSIAVVAAGPVRRLAIGLAVVVPAVVAATRVLLCVHFLSDVVAGLVLGAEVAMILASAQWIRGQPAVMPPSLDTIAP